MFITKKKSRGKEYLYLCQSIRIKNKVKQIILKSYGEVNADEELEIRKNILFSTLGNKCIICCSKKNLSSQYKLPLILTNSKYSYENLFLLCERCVYEIESSSDEIEKLYSFLGCLKKAAERDYKRKHKGKVKQKLMRKSIQRRKNIAKAIEKTQELISKHAKSPNSI